MKIDFMGLILRNSFTNIHQQCRFVLAWRDVEDAYLLDGEIQPDGIESICKSTTVLIDGTYQSKALCFVGF